MSRLSNEQILSNIYYDLERGYGSAKSLYEQAKEEGAVITLEEVKNFMKKQPNKQIKGYQNYNSYLVPYARAEFQIDIMDMNKFKQEGEERYGLIVIDAKHHFKKLRCPFVIYAINLSNQKMMKLRPTIIKSINRADLCWT